MVSDITQGKNFQILVIFPTDTFSHLLGIALCLHSSETLPGEYNIYVAHSHDRELNRGIFLSSVLVCPSAASPVLLCYLGDGSVLPCYGTVTWNSPVLCEWMK